MTKIERNWKDVTDLIKFQSAVVSILVGTGIGESLSIETASCILHLLMCTSIAKVQYQSVYSVSLPEVQLPREKLKEELKGGSG